MIPLRFIPFFFALSNRFFGSLSTFPSRSPHILEPLAHEERTNTKVEFPMHHLVYPEYKCDFHRVFISIPHGPRPSWNLNKDWYPSVHEGCYITGVPA